MIRNHNHIIINTNPKGTLHSKRSRQLFASKPTCMTSAYPTRMVLPIRIHNPTINPKQTRRDNRISNIRRSDVPYPPKSDYVFALNTSYVQKIQHGLDHFI